MSYFDGMRVGLYRETSDGRRVCARRSLLPWRKRWYYVLPEQEKTYEKRTLGVQVVSFLVIIFLVVAFGDRLFANPLLFFGFLIAPILPAFLYPTTAGLERANIDSGTLVPLSRKARSLEVARSLGAPTLWFLLGVSALLAAGQFYVLVTDGAWWAWLGLAMFTVSGAGTARQLQLLRGSDQFGGAS